MNLLHNFISCYSHIPYTFKHKIAIVRISKKLLNKRVLRYYFHDMDKLLLYMFLPFLGTEVITKIHRKINAHHKFLTPDVLTDNDMIEVIIDWESCRYTKPDKPETAREFCTTKHPELLYRMLPFLDLFGI